MRRTSTRGAAALALGLLGGVLAILAGGGRPAAAATLIQSCPFSANLPGTYVLARDLTCPGIGSAITIFANNVTLVLAGHTLTAMPGGVIGVFALNVTGLTITGGTIVGFQNADIFLRNTPNARVIGVTATGSQSAGIFVLENTGALLAGNTVTNNPDGILLLDSDASRVVGNTATGNGGIGIQVDLGSTGNQILGNTATGNGTDLVDGTPPPCVNTWRGNTFATKGGAGAACIR
jgi:parallel beta-helix repeat protein